MLNAGGSSGLPTDWYWHGIVADPNNRDRWLLWGNTHPVNETGFTDQGWLRFGGGQMFAYGTTSSPIFLTTDAGVTWTAVPLATPSLQVAEADASAESLQAGFLSDGSVVVTARVKGLGNFFGIPVPGIVVWRGSSTPMAATIIQGGERWGPTPFTLTDGAAGETLLAGAFAGYGTSNDVRVGYLAAQSSTFGHNGTIYDSYGTLAVDKLAGGSRGVVGITMQAFGTHILAGADYHAPMHAVLTTTVYLEAAAVTAAEDGVFVGGRYTSGVLHVTDLLSPTIASAVVPATSGVQIATVRADRQSRSAVAALRYDQTALYLRPALGAEWQTVTITQTQVSNRIEVLAGTAAARDEQERVQSKCHCQKDQPVDTHSGNYWTAAADLMVQTAGPELTWSRVYASQAISDTTGVLGYGWQHRYAARLIGPSMPGGVPGQILIVSALGNRERFADPGNGDYQPFPGISSTLLQAGGVFTQTLLDQQQLVFDGTSGRLLRLRDAQGRLISLSYDSSTPPHLTQIADAGDSSRALTLTYSGDRISSVSDGTRSVAYAYDGNGNLTSTTDVMGRVTTYTYATSSTHLLTQITNPAGEVIEQIGYDSATPPRVSQQTLRDGQ